jgi:hypothetical protein
MGIESTTYQDSIGRAHLVLVRVLESGISK